MPCTREASVSAGYPRHLEGLPACPAAALSEADLALGSLDPTELRGRRAVPAPGVSRLLMPASPLGLQVGAQGCERLWQPEKVRRQILPESPLREPALLTL